MSHSIMHVCLCGNVTDIHHFFPFLLHKYNLQEGVNAHKRKGVGRLLSRLLRSNGSSNGSSKTSGVFITFRRTRPSIPDSEVPPPLLDLLLHEEPVDGLLFPHELDNQSVQVDE